LKEYFSPTRMGANLVLSQFRSPTLDEASKAIDTSMTVTRAISH
jgi:hypothetical protein